MNHYIDNDDILYTNAAGTVRVRVVHDDDPSEPYNDGAMPTLRIDPHTGCATHVYGGHDYGFDAPAAWDRFAAHWGAWRTGEVFARYVAIFHGGSTHTTYNLGHVREYGYITFDTAAWAAAVGAPSARVAQDAAAWAVLGALSGHIPFGPGSPGLGFATGLEEATVTAALARLAAAGLAEEVTWPTGCSGWVRTDGAEAEFAEYRAYLEGECYGLVLEHKVHRFVSTIDLADSEERTTRTEHTAWEEVESIWGLYGDDRATALELAADSFDLADPPAAA